MSVDLAAFAPSHCDRGHYIGLHGARLVSWMPCACPPAVADPTRGRGHIYVRCRTCQDEGVEMVYYDPVHEP